MSYWRDPSFQEHLVAFLCRDQNFLRECGHLLSPDDFKPRPQQPPELWMIAGRALEFYQRYREPIGGMLRPEMLDYARQANLSERQRRALLDVVQRIRNGKGLVAVDAIAEKVLSYKRERLKGEAVEKMVSLQEQGRLTDEKWLELCWSGVEQFGKLQHESVDYFKTLEERIGRRFLNRRRHRFPFLMIDPLDEIVRTVARGHLGLLLAFAKMGKSLALEHIAVSYVLQGYPTLYFTLEDPREEVEDRMDAAITVLPMKRLVDLPRKLRKRFARFTRLLRSRLKIVDGTEGGMSVPRMEEIWERERSHGFAADAILIDYDDEIQATKKRDERRLEFADIYRDLRQLAAKRKVLVWTAAQATRQSEDKKVVTARDVAEDISKIRKAFCTVSIGKGDWGENSRYLYVVANKFDKQHVGCNIMADPTRGLFYDRDATFRRLVEAKENKEEE